MQDEEFESLEKANAQWDIWIDQEEYGKIDNSIQFEGPVDLFKKAFDHDHCTSAATNQWNELFQKRNLSSIALSSWQPPITLDSNWIPFFWAKFIRAKIQEKGTDCYFRRLDQQVLFYLERSLPEIISQDRDSAQETRQKIKLTVLYLLEMAAAGTGPDQRSFAERARRILKEHFAERDFFNKFYELLARYNIGVGFQHEGQKRKAVQEFNYIIYELKEVYEKQESELHEDKKEWKRYADHRKGLELIFIPAIFGRAAIQVKLQLAYHTNRTLSRLEKLSIADYQGREYIKARANYLKAEAYRLNGDFRSSENCLREIASFLSNNSDVDLNAISQWDTKKYPNIMGRLIDTFVALRLDQMKNDVRNDADSFSSLLKKYWNTARFTATNREGYLLLTAEILAFLAKKKDSIYSKTLKEIYDFNREPFLEDETHSIDGCKYCDTKGIDLRKMSSKHYEDFRKHLSEFFKRYHEDTPIPKDKKVFGNRLIDIEKKREGLEWRKRQIDYLLRGVGDSSSWCETCVPTDDSGFPGLLACRENPEEKGDGVAEKCLTALDYEHIMDTWDNHFTDHLEWRTVHEPKKPSLHFLGLQRWNSTSPAQGRSVGGGYLLYHTNGRGRVDCGIAIDPGFDFVRNLFHAGFSLSDIDLVLLSHAHIDHVRDFESMVTLYLELYKRKRLKRRPHVIMTLGIYRRLAHIIESPGLRKYLEPYIIDIEKEVDDAYLHNTEFMFESSENSSFENALSPVLEQPNKGKLSIKVKPVIAYHNDFSDYSDSFGFSVEIKTNNSTYHFGYTGDTSWHSAIMDDYKECDALLVHLGSLIDREKEDRRKFSYYFKSERCWELAIEKNHPYLMGMLHFFKEFEEFGVKEGKSPLILMSEFGEELRGRIRLDLGERLRRTFPSISVLPVDVGLDVQLNVDGDKNNPQWQNGSKFPKVFCIVCHDFVKLDRVDFETYGHDEALFCVCKSCRKSTPLNVLQEKLRSLHEIGRRLLKDDGKIGPSA